MRYYLILISILLFAPFHLFASEEGQSIPITVVDENNDTSPSLRSPVYIPIQAYYDEESSSVFLSFCQNIGNVYVVILNTTSGESISYRINSLIGIARLMFAGTNGAYKLTIHSSKGGHYIGEYIIYH